MTASLAEIAVGPARQFFDRLRYRFDLEAGRRHQVIEAATQDWVMV